MAEDGLGLEITELRLGLPGGGAGGGERSEKKRVFLDILGGGSGDVDLSGKDGGGKSRNMEDVVGWPPVCSYRKKSIQEVTKMYVKVSMDGAPFLRKIDMSGFKGYPEFVMALENLFGLGEAMKDEHENHEYMPIYEDKDGDWMLVGDVPWEMFTGTCKKLRMKKRVLDGGLQTKNLMTN